MDAGTNAVKTNQSALLGHGNAAGPQFLHRAKGDGIARHKQCIERISGIHQGADGLVTLCRAVIGVIHLLQARHKARFGHALRISFIPFPELALRRIDRAKMDDIAVTRRDQMARGNQAPFVIIRPDPFQIVKWRAPENH